MCTFESPQAKYTTVLVVGITGRVGRILVRQPPPPNPCQPTTPPHARTSASLLLRELSIQRVRHVYTTPTTPIPPRPSHAHDGGGGPVWRRRRASSCCAGTR